jgi:hypothetical protein
MRPCVVLVVDISYVVDIVCALRFPLSAFQIMPTTINVIIVTINWNIALLEKPQYEIVYCLALS